MSILKMSDLDLQGKRVLIREDLNVPLKDGKISNDARIQAALPTIKMAMEKGARVIVTSHLDRPEEGTFNPAFSLSPIAESLSANLKHDVPLIKDWIDGINVEPGHVVLCENVRFNIGELSNDEALSKKLAALCDVFVMDAFGTSHRANASTHGVARYASVACAGPLLIAELEALTRALDNPTHPVLAIVGGAKVSTKINVLESLITKVDKLIVGGGIANTFIAASGYSVGKSLYQADLIEDTIRLMAIAKEKGVEIPIPTDVIVGKALSETAKAEVRKVSDVADDEMILDIGPETAKYYASMVATSNTILWNGPVGVFEIEQFSEGTRSLAAAIADSDAFSIAGGGDTLAAIEKFNMTDDITYVSTGGGAFLEFIQGKTLPAVAALQQHAAGGTLNA